MLDQKVVLKKMKRLKRGPVQTGIKGRLPSRQDLAQLSFQLVKNKRSKKFYAPKIHQQVIAAMIVIQECQDSLQIDINLAMSTWFYL